MAIAGAPPISLAAYLPYSILPSRRCPPPMAASSTPTSTSKEHQIMPKEFSYSRADPSVRWPNLKLDEHFFSLQRNVSSPPNTVAEPQLQKAEIESDREVEQLENPASTASTESHDDKKRRSRPKKMTKLELTRAKDWRRRAQLLADQILALLLLASLLTFWTIVPCR
ncbi:hypothetical protein HPP92_002121 [Vanilla planifolia]|uniref:Uncharacterized protein n=1 Tax=Vanilla planifolia TaxID=51239 RepID=A0A835S5T7_VANPL|nr:hypothetical protein HPP92_002121 [Vanilla planifolia]